MIRTGKMSETRMNKLARMLKKKVKQYWNEYSLISKNDKIENYVEYVNSKLVHSDDITNLLRHNEAIMVLHNVHKVDDSIPIDASITTFKYKIDYSNANIIVYRLVRRDDTYYVVFDFDIVETDNLKYKNKVFLWREL
ncbi:MAG: hypothetical protein ABIL45_04135 [candidate division WOR-3 bacterium]